jgi:3-oxoacyl-[acyl-carrier protein] reductase
VVNNYGGAEGSDWPLSDAASWHSSYDTNVVSAIRVTNEFVDGMRSSGWGRIVFVSTVGATRPGERIPEYYAAKGALPSIAVSLAKHLANTGITVNCVAPGFIATDMTADLPEAQKAALKAQIAMGDLGQPSDIAHAVAYLASAGAGYVTGQELHVNGGMYM